MFEMKAVVGEYHIDFVIIEDNKDEDEVVAKGSVKWDGCSNWDMRPDDVMLHFCSLSDMKEFNLVLESCYQYAKEHFNNEFFD